MNKETKEVYVLVDWESTGLWTPSDEGYLANDNYENFSLPKDLVQRFEYWTNWFSRRRPEASDDENQFDSRLFASYGLALAIDLKNFLKNDRRVFYGHKTDNDLVEIVLIERSYDGALVPKIIRANK